MKASPMSISVPPRLAAKLRARLTELEMPASSLYGGVREYLERLLEDGDEALTDGWVYPDRAAAERVAARFFKRCPGYSIALRFDPGAQEVRFEDPNATNTAQSPAPRTDRNGKVLLSRAAAKSIVENTESMLENTSYPMSELTGLHGRSLLKAWRKQCRERIRKRPEQADSIQGNLVLVQDEVAAVYLEACDALGLVTAERREAS